MPLFDTVTIRGREGQVKCWASNMDTYTQGNRVGYLGGKGTYSVAMREGGFINVNHRVLESWTDEPQHKFIFDKWGNLWNQATMGKPGLPY